MDTPEYMQMIQRLIRRLGERVGEEDPSSLRHLRLVQQYTEGALRRAIDDLRQTGYTDVQIGAELGMTRQAVQQKWPRPAGSPVGAGARWVRR